MIVANYSEHIGVRYFGKVKSNYPHKIVDVHADQVILLRLNVSPSRTPYINFSDTNAVWKFIGIRNSDTFLDLWMAYSIAEFSQKNPIWPGYKKIYCPGSIFHKKGGNRWVIPLLVSKKRNGVWKLQFVSNGVPIEDKETEAIGYIPTEKILEFTSPSRHRA